MTTPAINAPLALNQIGKNILHLISEGLTLSILGCQKNQNRRFHSIPVKAHKQCMRLVKKPPCIFTNLFINLNLSAQHINLNSFLINQILDM